MQKGKAYIFVPEFSAKVSFISLALLESWGPSLSQSQWPSNARGSARPTQRELKDEMRVSKGEFQGSFNIRKVQECWGHNNGSPKFPIPAVSLHYAQPQPPMESLLWVNGQNKALTLLTSEQPVEKVAYVKLAYSFPRWTLFFWKSFTEEQTGITSQSGCGLRAKSIWWFINWPTKSSLSLLIGHFIHYFTKFDSKKQVPLKLLLIDFHSQFQSTSIY